MPDAIRFLISGYYGYANPGDEAILSVLVSELKSNFPDSPIAVISGTPANTERDHSVQAILWSDPLAIAEAVRQADIVITGGGGILHDYGGFSQEGLLSEGNWGLGFHITAGLLAALYGKPNVLYGIGVGPIFSDIGRRYVKALCDSAAAITVRDEASADVLAQCGVPLDRVQVNADPAFLFTPASAERAKEILASEQVPSDGPRVGVVTRHWSHEVSAEHWEQETSKALDEFLSSHQGMHALFIPFQEFQGNEEDDFAPARRVQSRMEQRDRTHILQGNYTPAEKAALIGQCNFLLAMRLHALIFAAHAGVPFLAMAYDEKVRQVGRGTGREAFTVEMKDLQNKALLETMNRAFETPVSVSSAMSDRALQNTAVLVEVCRNAPHSVLQGESLELIREAVHAQLTEQKRLRTWLRDQRINYEFQVQQQQELLEKGTADHVELQTRFNEAQGQVNQLGASLIDSEQRRAGLRILLNETETTRQLLSQKADVVEKEKRALMAELARVRELLRKTNSDWDNYTSDLNGRLANYRRQKPWQAMLALHKGYRLLLMRGWRGKLRFFPWLLSLLTGGGDVETEQLEFPVRPKRD